MARLILVRHGNTFDAGETPRRVGARTDLPLSASGRVQAEALGRHFSQVRFDAAFASTLRRTRQTANAILGARKDAPALRIEPFLTEIDYGSDEGKTEDEVIARLGKPALEAWDQNAIPPEGWQADPAKIVAAWQNFVTRLAAANGTVLCVTSNGIARFLPAAAKLDAPSLDLKLKTGAYSDLDITPEGVMLKAWNVRP